MAEIANIQLGGVSNEPNDYLHEEGDLTLAVNAVMHNGSIRPIGEPTAKFTLDVEGYKEKCWCVHSVGTDERHYILSHQISDEVYAIDIVTEKKTNGTWSFIMNDQGYENREQIGSVYTINTIKAVGNTLVVMTTKGIWYFLWKNKKYIDLGCHMPEVELRFYMDAEEVVTRSSESGKTTSCGELTVPYSCQVEISYSVFQDTGELRPSGEDARKTLTDAILAAVNSVEDMSKRSGCFNYPFFVRYGIRMYDGSITNLSAPILMKPSNYMYPRSQVFYDWETNFTGSARVAYTRLKFNMDATEELSNWEDVIDGISIFITPQFQYYDETAANAYGVSIEHTTEPIDIQDEALVKNMGLATHSDTNAFNHRRIISVETPAEDTCELYIDPKTDSVLSAMNEQLKEPSSFFLVRELSFGECCEDIEYQEVIKEHGVLKTWTLSTEPIYSVIGTSILATLETQTALSSLVVDSYRSHDNLLAENCVVYNSRISIGGTKYLIDDDREAYQFVSDDSNPDDEPTYQKYDMRILLKTQNAKSSKDYPVITGSFYGNASHMFDHFFSVNPDAVSVLIYTDGSQYVEHTLEKCIGVTGASYFVGQTNGHIETEGTVVEKHSSEWTAIQEKYRIYPVVENTEEELTEYTGNIIKTSEVNNPFIFPPSLTNELGTGSIIGLATSTKAISIGQFGEYPLFAFCEDGVWALRVSDTGSYSTTQPIGRDVCTNADSITETDSSVLFATERGIMQIVGNEIQCISTTLNGHNFIDSIRHAEEFAKTTTTAIDIINSDNKIDIPNHLIKFFQSCKIVYSYRGQKVFFFSDDYKVGYIYSLTSGKWGQFDNGDADSGLMKMDYAIPGNIDSLYVGRDDDDNHSVLLLPNEEPIDEATLIDTAIITRPITFNAPDYYKTIYDVYVRGIFDSGDVSLVIWGSNDGKTFYTIGSSTTERWENRGGTPYRYFRVGIIGSLQERDSLNSLSISYNVRLNSKQRL